LAFLVLLVKSFRTGFDRNRFCLGVLALFFGVSFAAVIVFLRAGPRGLYPGLLSNSYYAYIFNLSVILFIGSLANLGPGCLEYGGGTPLWMRVRLLGKAMSAHRTPKKLQVLAALAGKLTAIQSGGQPPYPTPLFFGTSLARTALALALVGLVGANFCRVWAQGQAEAQWSRPALILAEQIRKIEKAQGSERNFGIFVARDHPGERELPYVGRAGSDGHILTVAEVLFPDLYTRVNPRYVLWKRHRGFDILSCPGQVLGIPNGAWPKNLANLTPQEKARCHCGGTPEEVEQSIDSGFQIPF
jgi:hypothetical protein